MKYEIDQSGKIEQTERDTVIACINGTEITIFLKKAEKRIIQKIFNTMDMHLLFPYLTFAALLALLIQKLQPKNKIIIDKEYIGHEILIEEKVTLYLEQLGVQNIPVLEFGHVGKLSAAHNLAYLVAVGKKEPDLVVNSKDVMEVIIGTKKDRSRLTQEWLPGDQRSTDHKSILPQKSKKVNKRRSR